MDEPLRGEGERVVGGWEGERVRVRGCGFRVRVRVSV
jgi:hypothetical protein